VDDTVVEFEVLNFCQRGCSAKSTKEATYCNNNLASRLNATGNDCIAFFVQVDGNDLSAYGVKGSSQLGVSNIILSFLYQSHCYH
jgi:hypothetical protein